MTLTIRSNDYGLPSEHEMAVFSTMAKQAVTSKMYRGIGEEAGVMMIMLSAREFGIPAMQALNGGLNIINGKVELSARMIGSLIHRAGHDMAVLESTDTKCTIRGKRRNSSETLTVSYTLLEAQKAGLVKPGGGWTKNPLDMCFARATSRLARQLFPDVIGIGYVAGEISDAIETAPQTGALVSCESSWEQEGEENAEDEFNRLVNQYLDLFDDADDKLAARTYLTVVQYHFSWDAITTIRNLLKDTKKTIEAFHKWKNNKIVPIKTDP